MGYLSEYNGVQLPNLVESDKDYAIILKDTAESPNYFLVYSDMPFFVTDDYDGSYHIGVSVNATLEAYQRVLFWSETTFTPEETTDGTIVTQYVFAQLEYVWTNIDITNQETGEVMYTASEPIPVEIEEEVVETEPSGCLITYCPLSHRLGVAIGLGLDGWPDPNILRGNSSDLAYSFDSSTLELTVTDADGYDSGLTYRYNYGTLTVYE